MMKNIIPVISGKGGVGKSTVAVNLALALAQTGSKVALVDCDFYGPSIPTLLGGGQVTVNEQEKLVAPEKYGLKYISLGFFLQNRDDAVIWRGPMFNKGLSQMFEDVDWGEIDYCIVDMPPGTGDAQISLAQNFKITGALVVTTPQEVALADVRKAINMLSKVNVDVLGIVENMSGFVTPDGKSFDIFGSGGGAKLAENLKVPLLLTIPIDLKIRESGDQGIPAVLEKNSQAAALFSALALKLKEITDKKQRTATALNIIS